MVTTDAGEHRPLVSVVTATYNWSSVLRYAIQSVQWQTYPNFEHLIIGDGCTDDTAEVVGQFADARIRFHNLPTNSGSQAIPNNQGLAMARGRYIAYLGHDDVWHPRHLECLVGALETTGGDLAYSLCEFIGPPGSNVRQIRGFNLQGYYSKRGPHPSAMMHRREVVDQIGGWKDFREISDPPDRDFQKRACRHGLRFIPVPELTAFKFPSACRPNSYKEKPCHEQAELVRRMREEPDFLVRELLNVVAIHELKLPQQRMPKAHRFLRLFKPRGWMVHQMRRIRGLPKIR